MTISSVKEFAEQVNIPVDRLLKQLADAGVTGKAEADEITDEEKTELLTFLRKAHGARAEEAAAKPSKITLKRKVTGELKQASGARRRTTGLAAQSNKVKLVVRRKRTYVKREEMEAAEAEAEQAAAQEQPTDTEPALVEELPQVTAGEPQAQEVVAPQEPDAQEAVAQEAAATPDAGPVEPVAQTAAESEPAEAERATQPADTKPAPAAKPEPKEPPSDAAKPSRRAPPRETPGGRPPSKKGRGREDNERPGKLREIKVSRKRSKGRGVESPRRAETRHGFAKPVATQTKEITVGETITVAELASRMSVKAAEVIKALMGMGQMVTINQPIDQDTAMLAVEELGHRAVAAKDDNPELELGQAHAEAQEQPRAPVVTVMGHVDHGKTSLLDYIRKTRVAAGESGGITQHIGAYYVTTDQGPITFLDTPGHAAFSAMRARGAMVTDLVVLVVAADDGVMPQTEEAIQHAKAAEVPIVVAVNKIDKPDADRDRVMQELVSREVIPEAWGGDTQFVFVSAKTGEGVDELLESLALQSEIMELKAPTEGPATGVVIESRLDRGRGPVATVLVQKGVLRKGDVVLAGSVTGRARMLLNAQGAALDEAGPSIPVELQGLSSVPDVGDPFNVVEDERKAREIAQFREQRLRDAALTGSAVAGGDGDIFDQLREQQVKQLNIIVKADVRGSAEALVATLEGLSTDEVAVKVVASGVGAITETDANLAISTGSLIVGFNVRADATARRLIQSRGVDLRYHSVIYEAIDEVKAALGGMLEPEVRQEIIGLAEVREVFHSKAMGDIAGCRVLEGSVKRNNPIRVLRDNVVIYEGELESLRRVKDDVNEVKAGVECGIGVKDYNNVQVGDQIECFERITVQRTL